MNTTPDLTAAAIKMVLSLGVVLLIVWVLFRFAKNKLPVGQVAGNQKNIKLLESQYVGLKKSVVMVEVPGEILVLGLGADSLSLLTKIDDPSIINGLKDEKEGTSVSSFKEHFHRLIHPKKNFSSTISSD